MMLAQHLEKNYVNKTEWEIQKYILYTERF